VSVLGERIWFEGEVGSLHLGEKRGRGGVFRIYDDGFDGFGTIRQPPFYIADLI
jgi:hypothetical protein